MDSVQRKRTIIWLFSVCALVFSMVVVGGVTRLTHSGLSMVEWKPLVGTIPPLTQEQWENTFEKYKQFPEYQKVNKGMTLSEFKFIFFWEYFHRLLGRLIGLVFFVPFLWFLLNRYYDWRMVKKLLFGFFLGGMQGLMGWYMVKSGLVDRPSVSHYRLAAHLSLAFAIFAYLYWIILDLWRESRGSLTAPNRHFRGSVVLTASICVQIVFGAFVAGKKAGFGYNTFPKMGDEWVADTVFMLEPFWVNFFENNPGIQFAHRMIAWFLLIGIPIYLYMIKKDLTTERQRRASRYLHIILGVQFLLGVFTLISQINLALAAIHQAGAFFLFAGAIYFNHVMYKPDES